MKYDSLFKDTYGFPLNTKYYLEEYNQTFCELRINDFQLDVDRFKRLEKLYQERLLVYEITKDEKKWRLLNE